jgi:hypothetical protein
MYMCRLYLNEPVVSVCVYCLSLPDCDLYRWIVVDYSCNELSFDQFFLINDRLKHDQQ